MARGVNRGPVVTRADSRRAVTCCLLLAGSIVGACNQPADSPESSVSFSATVDSIAQEYERHVGQSLNRPVYVHFVRGGRQILVLDNVAPHLRLLDVDGHPLWSGLGDDADVGRHTASGVSGDTVLLAQRGALTAWVLTGDSVEAAGRWELPDELLPLGVVVGCEDGWWLYATTLSQPDPEPGSVPPHADVSFIYALDLSRQHVQVAPVWTDRTPLPLPVIHGHSGSLISRYDGRVVVLHRPSGVLGGDIVELTCDGAVLSSLPEQALVDGEGGVPVLEPRPRALEWTAGIVASPGGFMTAQHRWFSPRIHGVAEEYALTEIFEFNDARFQGSTLVPGLWSIVAYDPEVGIALTSGRWDDPFSRLMVIPVDIARTALPLIR